MKTTLVIDDGVLHRLRVEAARRGCTISYLVESALRLLLDPQPEPERESPPNLPGWDLGVARVDLADRDALCRAMEEHQ